MNHLPLNINKCKFMHFYEIKTHINFQYTLFNSNIELVSQFKDLGIIFDTKLNFSYHSEMIKNYFIRLQCRILSPDLDK